MARPLVSVREQVAYFEWVVTGSLAVEARRPAAMWTQENRARYDRSKLRYPSNLTDEEGALIRLLIPPAKPGGNKRTVDERAVVNGVMYSHSSRWCDTAQHKAVIWKVAAWTVR